MTEVYKITDFGARTCDVPQTDKIQAAIDACFKAGGGRVVIPKGFFLSGGIRLRSNVTLYLEAGAMLKASRNPLHYMAHLDDKLEPLDISLYEGRSSSVNPMSRWSNGFIRVINAENVSVIGEPGSFIDGSDCFDPEGEEKYRGPHGMNMHNVKNLHLEGYTLMNTGNWAHAVLFSENITVKNITVLGGHDGFDLFDSDNVLMENCEYYVGDDAIAGYGNKDVVIRNCFFNTSCSSLRFGGTDVLVENCRGIGPGAFGHRLTLTREEMEISASTHENTRHNTITPFQYYCDFRLGEQLRYTPGNITFKNCKFEDADSIILHPFDGKHKWCANIGLSSLSFIDCELLGLSKKGVLHADENHPLDLRFKNVKISAREEGADFPLLEASDCKYIEFDGVTVEGFKDPYIVTDCADKVKLINCTPIRVIEEKVTVKAGDCTQN